MIAWGRTIMGCDYAWEYDCDYICEGDSEYLIMLCNYDHDCDYDCDSEHVMTICGYALKL